MADVLGSGTDPDRPPRRWPTLALGVLVIAGVAVALLVGSHGPERTPAAARPSRTFAGPSIAAPSTYPFGPPPSGPPPPCRSCGGPIVPSTSALGPAGLRLLVGGSTVQVMEAATGSVQVGPAIPVDSNEHVAEIVPFHGEYAVLVLPGPPATEVSETPTGSPGRVYVTGSHGPARASGVADRLLPGTAGGVWRQTFYRPGGDAAYDLAELGTSKARWPRLPASLRAERMTPAGLIASQDATSSQGSFWGARRILLIPPGSKALILTDRAVALVGATDAELVWSSAPNRVTTYDLDRHSARTVSYPGDDPALYGSLSSDGRRLAAGFSGPPGLDDQQNPTGRLQVVPVGTDDASGALTLPGVATVTEHRTRLVWVSNTTLIAGLADGTRLVLVRWDAASGRTSALRTHGVQPDLDTFAVLSP